MKRAYASDMTSALMPMTSVSGVEKQSGYTNLQAVPIAKNDPPKAARIESRKETTTMGANTSGSIVQPPDEQAAGLYPADHREDDRRTQPRLKREINVHSH